MTITTYIVMVVSVDDIWVHYKYKTGRKERAGKSNFPKAEVGQTWEIDVSGNWLECARRIE